MNIWKIILFSIFLFLISYFLKSRNSKLFIEKFFFNEEATEETPTEGETPTQGETPTEETAVEETPSEEQLEAERLEAERLEAERLEAERLEAERVEAEKAKKARAEKAKKDKAEKDKKDKAEKAQAQKTAERIAKKVAIDAAKKLLFKMGSGPFGWISLIITEVLKNVLNLDPKDFVDCPGGYYQADKLPNNIKKVISIVPVLGDVFTLLGNKLCIKLGCTKDKFEQVGLCYNRCRDGYTNVGPVCWKTCGGDIDVGALCRERCRDGYSEIAGICYKNCGSGEKDIGLACVKK